MKKIGTLSIATLLALSLVLNAILLKSQKSNSEYRGKYIEELQKGADQDEKKILAIDTANLTRSICGIYTFSGDRSRGIPYQEMDLRSDGTGVLTRYNIHSNFNWRLFNEKVVLIGNNRFMIEDCDLIDSSRNRWIHIR